MFSVSFLLACLAEAARGIPYTLLITAVSIAVALVIGCGFALIRIHKIPGLNLLVIVFVSLIRGTPVIAQLFLVYFCLPMAVMTISPRANLYNANPLFFAFIVFSFNATSSMTEILRSALSSVEKGQLEASLSVGMTNFQAYRRIIIPQAAATALPALCNLTTGILKMTSLGMQISVMEITGRAKTLASESYRYLEGFVACLIIYLILNFLIEKFFRSAEIHMKRYKALPVE
ncbi:amino acid ABC transporter permease [Oscillibacter sp.]|uniref:amino acid ABC transporter permease n=1 Tax=Oscillibacter sp. TaxID=1945593 RepID=UPI0028A114E4|nr:amino acid ABC transporter permease [Oscillibacter sp.]